MHPGRVAGWANFLLPNRDQFLEPIDRVPAGGKGFGPMRRADSNSDAHFADFQPAEPMDHRHFTNRPARPHVRFNFSQLALSHRRVCFVFERERHLLTGQVADCAEKRDHAAAIT